MTTIANIFNKTINTITYFDVFTSIIRFVESEDMINIGLVNKDWMTKTEHLYRITKHHLRLCYRNVIDKEWKSYINITLPNKITITEDKSHNNYSIRKVYEYETENDFQTKEEALSLLETSSIQSFEHYVCENIVYKSFKQYHNIYQEYFDNGYLNKRVILYDTDMTLMNKVRSITTYKKNLFVNKYDYSLDGPIIRIKSPFCIVSFDKDRNKKIHTWSIDNDIVDEKFIQYYKNGIINSIFMQRKKLKPYEFFTEDDIKGYIDNTKGVIISSDKKMFKKDGTLSFHIIRQYDNDTGSVYEKDGIYNKLKIPKRDKTLTKLLQRNDIYIPYETSTRNELIVLYQENFDTINRKNRLE
jgi:hypothetical protein